MTLILISHHSAFFILHFVIKPVYSNHMSYMTLFQCSLGRSYKTGLIVCPCNIFNVLNEVGTVLLNYSRRNKLLSSCSQTYVIFKLLIFLLVVKIKYLTKPQYIKFIIIIHGQYRSTGKRPSVEITRIICVLLLLI